MPTHLVVYREKSRKLKLELFSSSSYLFVLSFELQMTKQYEIGLYLFFETSFKRFVRNRVHLRSI